MQRLLNYCHLLRDDAAIPAGGSQAEFGISVRTFSDRGGLAPYSLAVAQTEADS